MTDNMESLQLIDLLNFARVFTSAPNRGIPSTTGNRSACTQRVLLHVILSQHGDKKEAGKTVHLHVQYLCNDVSMSVCV